MVCVWTLPILEDCNVAIYCVPDLLFNPSAGLLRKFSWANAWSGLFCESEACDTPLKRVGIAWVIRGIINELKH